MKLLSWMSCLLLIHTIVATSDSNQQHAKDMLSMHHPTPPVQNRQCAVSLYSQPIYTGMDRCLSQGSYSYAQLKSEGYTLEYIQSIIVESGFRVRLIGILPIDIIDDFGNETLPLKSIIVSSSHQQHQLTEITFESPASHLHIVFNTSSTLPQLIITSCPVAIYGYDNYRGDAVCLEPGTYTQTTDQMKQLLKPVAYGYGSLLIQFGFKVTITTKNNSIETHTRPERHLKPGQGSTPISITIVHLSTLEIFSEQRVEKAASESSAPAHAEHTTALIPLSDYNRFLILGDSLSDQTNQWNNKMSFAVPQKGNGYWHGRFSNGYNWVDYMGQDNVVMSNKFKNMAVGGACATKDQKFWGVLPSINSQYDKFRGGLSAVELAALGGTLAFVWAGPNDMMSRRNDYSAVTAQTFAFQIVQAYADITQRMYNDGIRSFLWVDVPNISTVPKSRVSTWSSDPAWLQWLNNVATIVNSNLAAYRANPPLANLKFFGLVPIANFITQWQAGTLATYQSAAMTDRTNSCFLGGAEDQMFKLMSYVDKPCPLKMFFDYLHPTSLAHCGIADYMATTMSQYIAITGAATPAARINSCASRARTDGNTGPSGGGSRELKSEQECDTSNYNCQAYDPQSDSCSTEILCANIQPGDISDNLH